MCDVAKQQPCQEVVVKVAKVEGGEATKAVVQVGPHLSEEMIEDQTLRIRTIQIGGLRLIIDPIK
tara:strand:- start:3821 stop:4015 length:195 start_codon:yes stop_codon:yes gene_type:complete